ncbi:hypothetical protein MASR2M47_20880 [Draconibacterium sp.]
MKVLTVTNMLPIPEHPYFGIFVKEQIEGLKNTILRSITKYGSSTALKENQII